MTTLPDFTEHDEHSKLRPLTGPLEPSHIVVEWLATVVAGRDPSQVRVLDLGCGNGGTVAWLLERGYDAYGLDVDQRYVDNGERYLASCGQAGRLEVIPPEGYPFPDEYFDIVLSNQVFEHVADLDQLAREVSRVTKRGGAGLHLYPGRWLYKEAHMGTPPVHWLPKGRVRRAAIRVALKTGHAAAYFTDLPLRDRVTIYSEYSDSQTFYRSQRLVAKTLRAAGFYVDLSSILDKRARERGIPAPLNRVAAFIYRGVAQMHLVTRKL